MLIAWLAFGIALLVGLIAPLDPMWTWLHDVVSASLAVLPRGESVFGIIRGTTYSIAFERAESWDPSQTIDLVFKSYVIGAMLLAPFFAVAWCIAHIRQLLHQHRPVRQAAWAGAISWPSSCGVAGVVALFCALTVGYSAYSVSVHSASVRFGAPGTTRLMPAPIGYSTYGSTLVLLGAVILAITIMAWCARQSEKRIARRLTSGGPTLCSNCGYPQLLSNTPTGPYPPCPECGVQPGTHRPTRRLSTSIVLFALVTLFASACLFAPILLPLGARLIGSEATSAVVKAADTMPLRGIVDAIGRYPCRKTINIILPRPRPMAPMPPPVDTTPSSTGD